MIFFYKYVRKKVTEQFVNPILFFAAYFRVRKMKVNKMKIVQSDGCCN